MGLFGCATTADGREVSFMSDVMKWLREVRKLDETLLQEMGVTAKEHSALGVTVAFQDAGQEVPLDQGREPGALQHRRAFSGRGSAGRDYRGRD